MQKHRISESFFPRPKMNVLLPDVWLEIQGDGWFISKHFELSKSKNHEKGQKFDYFSG